MALSAEGTCAMPAQGSKVIAHRTAAQGRALALLRCAFSLPDRAWRRRCLRIGCNVNALCGRRHLARFLLKGVTTVFIEW